jgi:hypothetical protein
VRPATEAALGSLGAALVEAQVDADEKPVKPGELKVGVRGKNPTAYRCPAFHIHIAGTDDTSAYNAFMASSSGTIRCRTGHDYYTPANC